MSERDRPATQEVRVRQRVGIWDLLHGYVELRVTVPAPHVPCQFCWGGGWFQSEDGSHKWACSHCGGDGVVWPR